MSFNHDGTNVGEHILQPLSLLGHQGEKSGETFLLPLAQPVQFREGQPVKELGIILDGAAEEVSRCGDEKRRTLERPLREQQSEVTVSRFLQLPRHPLDDSPFTVYENLRIAESCERGGLLRQLLRMKNAGCQQASLARRPQLLQALLPKRRLFGGFGQCRRIEECPHLASECLVFRSRRGSLAMLPEGFADKGQLQRSPGPLVGVLQRRVEALAMIGEALRQESDDGDGSISGRAYSGRGAGAIDQLP